MGSGILEVARQIRMLAPAQLPSRTTRSEMSAAEQSDDHEEEVLHQAGWVYFLTYAVCLAFLALLMLINPQVETAFPGVAILWLTILSIPAQIYLARRNWTYFAGTLGVAAAGYFGFQLLLT